MTTSAFLRLADVDVHGKRVFIRSDLNVPQDDAGSITDDTRIRASVPAIQDALTRGAAVMVTSHLGRPTEGTLADADSLAPVAARLGELMGREVRLIRDWVDGGPWHSTLMAGDLVMLENCRVNPGEKKDSVALAQKMALLFDVYCNDAFGTAHRPEATTHMLARYAQMACAGPLLAAELDALGRALEKPQRPLVAIVAGAKVSTKLTILRALAAKVDTLIVGGGIANTFVLAAGGRIGKSLAEPDLVGEARAILEAFPGKVPIPVDVVCAKRFAADATPTIKAIGRRGRRRPDPRHRTAVDRDARTVDRRGRNDRVEWPRGRLRVRRVLGGHTRDRRRNRRLTGVLDCRRRRHRGGDQCSSASPTASRTSRRAVAHSWSSSKARRCQPSPR